MHDQSKTKLNNFARDVQCGLAATPKFLSSKYFYDDAGSKLFRQIMDLPEYYLTRAEAEIFSRRKSEITASFTVQNKPLDLIELGAGDGSKTAILIEYMIGQEIDFSYSPVDISAEAIEILSVKFKDKFPNLSIKSHCGDYFRILKNLAPRTKRSKIIFFLGSNIGNFGCRESLSFLKQLNAVMCENDCLFMGFDLQKDSRIILPAYDDAQGVTKAFNLNLLERINRELGANFETHKFSHRAEYCRDQGRASSFLVSCEKQSVNIQCLNRDFLFEENENILTEISQKYSLQMIEQLAGESGFKVIRNFFDERNYFVNSLWKTS